MLASALTKAAVAAVTVGMVAALTPPSHAGELPKSTQKILKSLKFDASILKGLDAELKMPKGWIAAAKKEGKLRIYGAWQPSEFIALSAPFNERYPFIKIQYSRPKRNDRATKPLIALRTGRYITDIVNGLGGKVFLYYKDNLLADLRDIPNIRNLPPGMMDPQGRWVGVRLRYWCVAYNTDKVKKADLPRNWEDILSTKRWHKGNLALANRPNQWVVNLWSAKGVDWTTNFITRLFNEVKPQLRKEGTSALVALLAAGEFHMSVSASPFRVQERRAKGAPVAFHCPDPAPVSITEAAILKGSPNIHAAKMYLNWVLSKEGQVAKFGADRATPIHKDLIKDDRFLPLGGQGISGGPVAMRGPKEGLMLPALYKVWNPLWEGASGTKYRTVKAKLVKVKRRSMTISVGGKRQKVKISGRRTKVFVKGKAGDRGDLKAGMTCKVTYPGPGDEAKKIDCD